MDRKGIIAIAIAIIVLLAWTQYYSGQTAKYAEARRLEQAEEAKKHPVAPAPAAAPVTIAPGVAAATPGASAPAVTASQLLEANTAEQLERMATPAVNYTFTNLGGGISRVALNAHKTEGDLPVQLNRFGSVPIGAISETGADQARLPFQLRGGAGTSEMTFERTDARKLQVVKKFTLPQAGGNTDEYVSSLDVTFTNHGDQPIKHPGYYVYTGAAAPLHQTDLPTYTGMGWMRGLKFVFKDAGSFREGGFLMFGKSDAPLYNEGSADSAWAGVTNQYYTSIITPLEQKGNAVWARRLDVAKGLIGHEEVSLQAPGGPEATPAETLHGVEAAIGVPGFDLAPGASVTQRFQLYTGPREYDRLKKLGAGQDAITNYGMFRVVSRTLLTAMNWLRAKLGTYALAIIVLTIIIRGLMWPLQNKATQSMKNIAALQPKMNELKEKYPDDPTRVQQETMKLYKQYKINPLMGCLPMLVQIPIFFGFYSMLGQAVELRNSPFLWVKDLSQPDTVAVIAGFPINVLPLLMAVTMFWQMRLSPKSGDPVQQRVFMFMPVIFVLFCYKYASALALYWTVQNLFSIVQLYITRNQPTPALQKVSASPQRGEADTFYEPPTARNAGYHAGAAWFHLPNR